MPPYPLYSAGLRGRHATFLSLKRWSTCPLVAPDPGEWRGTLSTTDATATAVTLYTPANSQAVQVKFRATALKTDGTKAAVWEISVGFRCDSTGTLAIVGSATSVAAAADSSFAPTAAVTASGANVIATLTGIASTNITWNFETRIA